VVVPVRVTSPFAVIVLEPPNPSSAIARIRYRRGGGLQRDGNVLLGLNTEQVGRDQVQDVAAVRQGSCVHRRQLRQRNVKRATGDRCR